MPFWEALDNGMGIFLTLAILILILTHSGEFISMIKQSGETVNTLFRSMSLQS